MNELYQKAKLNGFKETRSRVLTDESPDLPTLSVKYRNPEIDELLSQIQILRITNAWEHILPYRAPLLIRIKFPDWRNLRLI